MFKINTTITILFVHLMGTGFWTLVLRQKIWMVWIVYTRVLNLPIIKTILCCGGRTPPPASFFVGFLKKNNHPPPPIPRPPPPAFPTPVWDSGGCFIHIYGTILSILTLILLGEIKRIVTMSMIVMWILIWRRTSQVDIRPNLWKTFTSSMTQITTFQLMKQLYLSRDRRRSMHW